MLRPGDAFGRYVIEEVLGAGGGGEVYRARDDVLRRSVALKVLLAHPSAAAPASDPDAVRGRVLREARAAAHLNHPNVVSIFDVGEHEGVPYMAMELVEGRSLRDLVGSDAIPLERRLRWLSDIAVALEAAHKAGIVHGDVKPENVLVRADGFVKVVDFGIARNAAGGPPSSVRFEITGSASAGTPHYMPPEQIRGEPLDGRSDQFAWGVTAFELLSGGHLPWDSTEGTLKYVASVLSQPPAPLRDVAGGVPVEVATIVNRAIQGNRDDRFPTMGEIVRQLDPLRSQSGPDVVRHVVSVLPPADALAQQRTTRAPVSRPSGAEPTLPAFDGPIPRAPDPVTKGSRKTGSWAVAAVLALLAAAGTFALVARRGDAPAAAASASGSVAAPASAPVPTAITALPAPDSKSPEALAAYVEGVQALRDGLGAVANAHFKDAARLDPTMAMAHLRLAWTSIGRDEPLVREAYGHARALRAGLNERDRGLIEAFEPLLARSPADALEASRRFGALLDRYPMDAEIAFYVTLTRADAGEMESAMESSRRTMELDPSFFEAMAVIAQVQAYLGDLDTAMRTLDRCLEGSHPSTYCSYTQGMILAQRGEAVALEEGARRVLAANETARESATLASALMAEGKPIAAVQQAFARAVELFPKTSGEWVARDAAFRLDVAIGSFDQAEVDLKTLEDVVARGGPGRARATAASDRVALYRETGRLKEAGAFAKATLEAMPGWPPESRVEDQGMSYDATPRMLAAERDAGLIDRRSFEAQIADWIAAWEKKAPRFYQRYLWLHAYGATVATPEDARKALVALEAAGGVPPFRPTSAASAGRAHLLAGDVDHAVAELEADAKACRDLDAPFEHLRSVYWLGRAREAQGNVEGACGAYARVLERWGKARPRSVTADETREHARALRCPP